MKYRITNDKSEIINSLASRLTKVSTITVWQKQVKNSRIILDKMLFEAIYREEMVFTLKGDSENFLAFDPKKDVYFLLEGHDYIFKTKMADFQKKEMTLEMPQEVRLKEFRCCDREDFKINDHKTVEVIFSTKNSLSGMSLSCPIINISKGGACFIISKESLSNIDFSSDVLFKFSSNSQTAIVRNVRVFAPKNLKNDEQYAIGIKFQ